MSDRPSAEPQNPRAARHIAVVSLFLEMLEEIDTLGDDKQAPSERALAKTMDEAVYLALHRSITLARREMAQLAPAKLAEADTST